MKADDFLNSTTKSADAFLGEAPKSKGLLDRLMSFIAVDPDTFAESQGVMPEASKAVLEAAASLGTGATSWIPAGLSMASFDMRSPTERAKTATEIQEALTYTPKSKAAQKLVEPVGQFFENYDIAGREYARNIENPLLATLVHTGTEAIPFLAPLAMKGVGAVKSGARDLAQLEGILERETATAPRVPLPEAAKPKAERFLDAAEGVPEPVQEAPKPPPSQEIQPVETIKAEPDVSNPPSPAEIVQPAVKEPWKMTRGEFSATETPVTKGPAKADIPAATTPKAEGGTFKQLAYNKQRESNGYELVSALNKSGAEIISTREISEGRGVGFGGERQVVSEIKYKDSEGREKHAYVRLLYDGTDGIYEDSIVSGKAIPEEYINDFFAKAGQEEAAFYKNIIEERAQNKSDIQYWIPKAKEIAKKAENENRSLIKEHGGDFDKAYSDSRWQNVNYYDLAKDMLAEHLKSRPNPSRPPESGGRLSELQPATIPQKSLTESPGMVGDKVNLAPEKGPELFAGPDITRTKEVLKGIADTAGETTVGRAARELIDKVHSPEVVLRRTPTGKRIYETADKADFAHKKFVADEGLKFEKAAKGITGEESGRVGMALDGKIRPDTLSEKEAGLYRYLKDKFSFLLHKYAREVAGNEDAYIKARSLANAKQKPQVKVSDLPVGKQNHYKGLKTPEDRAAYLHEAWKESQPEGFAKAYDALSRELRDYLPHMFDKDQLIDAFKMEKAELERKIGESINDNSTKQFKVRLKEVGEAIVSLEGGGWVKFQQLPKNLRFKFFEGRKGKQGYSFDAIKAYRSYLTGIARKIFDEPAVREMGRLYEGIEPELKTYTDKFIRHFAGSRKTNLDALADAVTSAQWIRTLGFNPRSALVNLTQRINTIADIGPEYSFKGQKAAFTEQGKKLFDESGLAAEVPQVLYEGGSPKFEKVRAMSAWMFNKVELGNRRHAFLSGYLKAMEKGGKSHAEAVQAGIEAAHRTQFRYGRVGIPEAMRGGAGRVALQFTSYPIKQIEFLADLARKDPKRFVGWLAMAEGGNIAMQQLLDADMSNAMGIGINLGEALETFRALTKADIREAFRHAKIAVRPGGGLLPVGLGPTVQGAAKVIGAVKEGKGFETLKREVTPVMLNRLIQAVEGVRGEKDGLYPIKSRATDNPQIRLNARQLLQRTVGPQTNEEKELYLNRERSTSLDRMRKEVSKEIVGKLLDGDRDGAKSLIQKYRIMPTKQAIKNEILRRNLTPEEIRKTRKPGQRQAFELLQEGRTY